MDSPTWRKRRGRRRRKTKEKGKGVFVAEEMVRPDWDRSLRDWEKEGWGRRGRREKRLHMHHKSKKGGRGVEREWEERGKRRSGSESGGGRVEVWKIYCIRYIWLETTSLHVKALSGCRGRLRSRASIPNLNVNTRTSCLQIFKKPNKWCCYLSFIVVESRTSSILVFASYFKATQSMNPTLNALFRSTMKKSVWIGRHVQDGPLCQ